jgi:divalent metal cation (Fe/Co/Zn/Cd) transporter
MLASTLDSFLDIFSGSVLFLAQIAIQRHSIYMFPAGRKRLEPLGIIVFAGLLFVSFLFHMF